MRAVWRIRFTWAFAILFSALSAMGEGLHLLPGQGHDACCRDAGCRDAGDQCCDEDTPPAAPIGAGSAVPVQWFVADASRTISQDSPLRLCDDENCAICKFFGQAVWFTRTASLPDWQFLLRFHRPAKEVVVVCRWEYLPFLSRAPPAPVDC
ncbi:MAG TPA: hypothetical protein VHX65_08385 [Pirellulales bacterium]|jgi:hypothetical protein|nr:hypothetical protein [Pirellulales bacterium]